MNKRLIAYLSILSLSLSLPLSPAKAAVKAGGTCSKVGTASVVSGKTYTCVKSGKKLIWNKGTKVIIKPAIVIPNTWPIDKPADKNIFLIADTSIRQVQATNTISPSIQLNYGPTTNKERVDRYLLSMITASKFWKTDWNHDGNVIVAMGTTNDFNWIKGFWDRYQQVGGGYDASEATYTAGGEYCNQGAASFGTNNQPFFWGCVSTKGELEIIGLKKFAAHEYTHLAHYGIMGLVGASAMPVLISEGSADFYGVVLGSTANKIIEDWKTYFSAAYISDTSRDYLKNATEAEIAELLVDSFNRSMRVDNHWYYTGAYVTLRMVAAKGHQGFVEFMKSVTLTRNANTAFESVYGITFDKFAKIIAPELKVLSSTIRNR